MRQKMSDDRLHRAGLPGSRTPGFTMYNSPRLFLAGCLTLALAASMAPAASFVFLNEDQLALSRERLQAEQAPAEMKQAYKHLLEEAAIAAEEGPFSVTDKTVVPPSGNMNDYLSLSPYWWPDESKPDGLPWIRRDGKTNPVSKTSDTDSRRIGAFTRSVRALAIAWYFSRDEAYATRGIEYLRIWFIDPETRMNPNMNFAQGVPGRADGRRSGLIDSRGLADRVLDAIAILSRSEQWTENDEEGIRAWFTVYLDWLLTSELGGGPKGEAFSENNHGSWYDLQVAGIAAFLQQDEIARQMVEKGKMRIDTQFEANGEQPHELARTRSYHYSYFNLDALTGLAQVGASIGTDLWTYTSPKGASLKVGIDLLAAYNDPAKEWPWPHQAERRTSRMASIYRKAGLALDDRGFLDLADAQDFSTDTVEDNLGEVWAQRDVQLLYPVP